MGFSSSLTRTGDGFTFALSGRIDIHSVDVFTEQAMEAARAAKAEDAPLVVDLSGLDFMVSRGLRALTMAQREHGRIRLARPQPDMADILRISRYDKLFEIEA
jgi:anti-anti-sigma factor